MRNDALALTPRKSSLLRWSMAPRRAGSSLREDLRAGVSSLPSWSVTRRYVDSAITPTPSFLMRVGRAPSWLEQTQNHFLHQNGYRWKETTDVVTSANRRLDPLSLPFIYFLSFKQTLVIFPLLHSARLTSNCGKWVSPTAPLWERARWRRGEDATDWHIIESTGKSSVTSPGLFCSPPL